MEAVAPNPMTLRAGDFYRSCGYNALPSRTDTERPRPRFTYAHSWETPFRRSIFHHFPRDTNIQVMCGVRWKLAVIDLDGPEAIEVWDEVCRHHDPILTWEVAHGAKGKHVWFSVPDGVRELPKRVLWEVPEKDHTKIELFGDRSLIVAPPSLHRSGERYVFLAGRAPINLARPALMPGWLLDLCLPAPAPVVAPTVPQGCGLAALAPRLQYRPADVRDAIPDKIGLASSWGVRLAAPRPNSNGWQKCHAINRPDRNPSAALSIRGSYWDASMGRTSLSLFDLGAALGRYPSWKDCVNDLGKIFGAPREARV